MSNNNSFGGKLKKVLASVCSLFVGASGVSQAGKSFDEALNNKKGIIAHFNFGDAGKSAKGTTKKIFEGLQDSSKNGFRGLLDGVCGNIPSVDWGYASLGRISGLAHGAGVQFRHLDGYIVIELIHDNTKLPNGNGVSSASARVLSLSLDDFDYIIENYQKDRLKKFIEEFKEVSKGFNGNNSLIGFLDHLKVNIKKRGDVDAKDITSAADLRRKFPYRYCASILALDLFSYIFDMELSLKDPYELIRKIFNDKCDCVELPSGVRVLRPEVFQDAFIRKWGYLNGKPVYELEKEIDSVCKSLNVGTEGTVGDKLKRVSEKASELLKSEERVLELQKLIGELENKLKLAGTDNNAKEELQKQLENMMKELKELSPSALELNEIGEALKDYGNVNDSKIQKVRKLLAEVNKLNDEFQKLQEIKLGKVVKWGSYPAVFAAGYLISKFVPNGGKKLNNVNKVENRNKNKGPNRDKKAKKRNNAKKN